MSNHEELKCAPSKKFKEGSCFTLEQLKKISKAFNNSINSGISKNNKKYLKYSKIQDNLINIKDDKKFLLRQLTDKLSNVCDNQLCWIRQSFVKKLQDQDILENTFRPKGPQGQFEWLSTTDIDKVMHQYEHKYNDFIFLGTTPVDFDDLEYLGIKDLPLDKLYKDGKTKLGMVINLDEHWQSGSHWVAFYADLKKNQIYFFDSNGTKPARRIKKLINRVGKWIKLKKFCPNNNCSYKDETFSGGTKDKDIEIEYNRNRHQFGDSECGVYSMNFILRLLKGESFKNIINNITKDDKMNKCRDTYFTYPNKNPIR